MRRITAFGAVLVAAGSLGCGIGEAMSDACRLERTAYEQAQRKQSGMKARGVGADRGVATLARDGARRTSDLLARCEARGRT